MDNLQIFKKGKNNLPTQNSLGKGNIDDLEEFVDSVCSTLDTQEGINNFLGTSPKFLVKNRELYLRYSRAMAARSLRPLSNEKVEMMRTIVKVPSTQGSYNHYCPVFPQVRPNDMRFTYKIKGKKHVEVINSDSLLNVCAVILRKVVEKGWFSYYAQKGYDSKFSRVVSSFVQGKVLCPWSLKSNPFVLKDILAAVVPRVFYEVFPDFLKHFVRPEGKDSEPKGKEDSEDPEISIPASPEPVVEVIVKDTGSVKEVTSTWFDSASYLPQFVKDSWNYTKENPIRAIGRAAVTFSAVALVYSMPIVGGAAVLTTAAVAKHEVAVETGTDSILIRVYNAVKEKLAAAWTFVSDYSNCILSLLTFVIVGYILHRLVEREVLDPLSMMKQCSLFSGTNTVIPQALSGSDKKCYGGIFAALLAGVGFSTIWRNYRTLRTVTSDVVAFTALPIKKLLNWMLELFGCAPLFDVINYEAKKIEFSRRMAEFNGVSATVDNLSDMDSLSNDINHYLAKEGFQKALGRGFQNFFAMKKAFDKTLGKLRAVYRGSASRIEPVYCGLHDVRVGTAKTTTSLIMIKQVLSTLHSKKLAQDYPLNLCCHHRVAGSPYWDGVSEKNFAVVMEELGDSSIAAVNYVQNSEITSLVNTAPFCVNMSDVPDKGTTFVAPLMVFSTSNNPTGVASGKISNTPNLRRLCFPLRAMKLGPTAGTLDEMYAFAKMEGVDFKYCTGRSKHLNWKQKTFSFTEVRDAMVAELTERLMACNYISTKYDLAGNPIYRSVVQKRYGDYVTLVAHKNVDKFMVVDKSTQFEAESYFKMGPTSCFPYMENLYRTFIRSHIRYSTYIDSSGKAVTAPGHVQRITHKYFVLVEDGFTFFELKKGILERIERPKSFDGPEADPSPSSPDPPDCDSCGDGFGGDNDDDGWEELEPEPFEVRTEVDHFEDPCMGSAETTITDYDPEADPDRGGYNLSSYGLKDKDFDALLETITSWDGPIDDEYLAIHDQLVSINTISPFNGKDRCALDTASTKVSAELESYEEEHSTFYMKMRSQLKLFCCLMKATAGCLTNTEKLHLVRLKKAGKNKHWIKAITWARENRILSLLVGGVFLYGVLKFLASAWTGLCALTGLSVPIDPIFPQAYDKVRASIPVALGGTVIGNSKVLERAKMNRVSHDRHLAYQAHRNTKQAFTQVVRSGQIVETEFLLAFIHSKQAFTVKHIAMNGDLHAIRIPGVNGLGGITFSVSELRFKHLDGRDGTIVTFPRAVQFVVDMYKNLRPKSQTPQIQDAYRILRRFHYDSKNKVYTPTISEPQLLSLRYIAPGEATPIKVPTKISDQETRPIEATSYFWSRLGGTINGDCGSPIVADGSWIACHNASGLHGSGIDYSVPIWKEDFDKPGVTLKIPDYVGLVNPQGPEVSPDGTVYLGTTEHKFPRGGKNRIHVSKLVTVDPLSVPQPVVAPARLGTGTKESFKFNRPAPEMPKYCRDLIQMAPQALYDGILGTVPDPKLRLLDDDEIVNGAPDLDVGPLDFSTSPGVDLLDCEKLPGRRGDHFPQVDGVRTMTSMIKERLRELEESLARDEVPMPVFRVTEKEELRLVEKAHRPRIICNGSMRYLLLHKKYFGNLLGYLKRHHNETTMAFGINPYGFDWHKLARDLSSLDGIWDEDFKAFDMSVRSWIVEVFYHWVKSFYPNLTKTQKKVLKNLCLYTLVNCLYVDASHIFAAFGCNPSGQFLTALVNGFYNYVIHALLYYYILAVRNFPCALKFKQAVFLKSLGDDVVLGHRRSKDTATLKKIFNRKALQPFFMEVLGMEMTSGVKDAEIVPFTRLSDLTFISRGFVVDNGRWIGPLKWSSIYGMLYYSKTKREALEDISQRLRSAALEITLYGKRSYKDFESVWRPRAEEVGLNWDSIVPSYKQMKDALSRNFHGEASGTLFTTAFAVIE